MFPSLGSECPNLVSIISKLRMLKRSWKMNLFGPWIGVKGSDSEDVIEFERDGTLKGVVKQPKRIRSMSHMLNRV